MNKKTMTTSFFVVAAGASAIAAVPEVTSAAMAQADDRRVTITYAMDNAPAVVTLDVQTNFTDNGETKWASIGGSAVCNAKGAVWRIVTSEDAGSDGKYTITWRPDLSWPEHKIADGGARAVVTAWALDNTPDYMVVDISAAAKPNTQKYYPTVEFLPGGLLDNPDYRTTSIVMRKIMAKDVEWTMGSTALETQRNASREATHKVTLTNNYYMGVFEVTQAQWALVQTDNPTPSTFSFARDRAMRPVETVCYNEIRNLDNATYLWPSAPNPKSFLGKLRERTRIDFDLPSESQWEFAARAGNGDTKRGDGSVILNTDTDANLDMLGRYGKNGGLVNGAKPVDTCGAENGTAIVGTYRPNDWGLYDTCGNLYEFCLDWFESNISANGGNVNIDPSAPTKTLSGVEGVNRVTRGGNWDSNAGNSRPAFRNYTGPNVKGKYTGIRLYCQGGLR